MLGGGANMTFVKSPLDKGEDNSKLEPKKLHQYCHTKSCVLSKIRLLPYAIFIRSGGLGCFFVRTEMVHGTDA